MSEPLEESRDGLSQKERKLKALFPQNLKIDQQGSLDLLYYLFGLSFELNFYNLKDEIEGDWSDFFAKDYEVLLLLTSKLNIVENEEVYLRIEEAIQFAEDKQQLEIAIQELFNFIEKSIAFIRSIQQYFYNSTTKQRSLKRLKDLLKNFEETILRFELVYHHVKKEIPQLKLENPGIKSLKNNSDSAGVNFSSIKSNSIRDKFNAYLPFIRESFEQLYTKFNGFLSAVKFFTKDHHLQQKEYPPHMALLMTFNQLYAHLQVKYNQLPKKHLDFYYEEILALKKKEAKLDSVHVIIEPEPMAATFVVEKGDLLVLESTDQVPIDFVLDDDLLVIKAKIEEVKMLSVFYPNGWVNKESPINELNLYSADCPIYQPEEIINANEQCTAWAAFGENQELLGYQEKTMDVVSLESIIASPILYLPEGERTIELNIYLSESTARGISQFINRFAIANEITPGQASFELFSKAFNIAYTTLTEWVKISKTSISFHDLITDSFIQIKCDLTVKDAAFEVYTFGVHGPITEVELPAIKLNLNNEALINPLTFINNLSVNRIQIQAKVNGFSSFSLFNTIGELSTVSAFQPFGPLPNVGSFLDIKNANVLNKFTKAISLQLDWFDLPNVKGGWSTYYQEYPTPIKNDSFKVKILSLTNGKVSIKKGQQQEEKLFQTYRSEEGSEFLKSTTLFDEINLQMLDFSNKLSFGKEKEIGRSIDNQGVLRIELCSPPESFGNTIYPQIFSEVMMHNNKKFVSKRNIPNPPYIPLIKNLTSNYILEQSISFAQQVSTLRGASLKIFHTHAYGFNTVYPKANDGSISLFPVVEEFKSILIGIKDLEPKQQLNLLFQLEENNFIDLATDSPEIKWSYLLENNWIYLPSHHILSDTTNNLIHSGIVKISIPNEINFEHTILRNDLTWLRMTVAADAKVFAKIKAIFTNAVSATRLRTNSEEGLKISLNPNSIKGFKNRKSGVKKVWQPFPSINGWHKESQEEFYVRVSERLRNRNRLVTILDIEQFILREFPQLLMVKCFHVDESPSKVSISKLKAVIIGKKSNDYLDDQPKVNMTTMFEVHEKLKSVLTKFTLIEVVNPTYEPVKIVADIKFKQAESRDLSMLLNQFQQDIRIFFCPWLNQQATEIKIGSKVFVSEVVKYIKNLPYVAHITKFSMVHFYKSEKNGKVIHQINDLAISKDAYLQGSVPEAILIPSEHHIINVVESENFFYPKKIGIGAMLIGEELLVNVANQQTKEVEIETPEEDYFDIVITNL